MMEFLVVDGGFNATMPVAACVSRRLQMHPMRMRDRRANETCGWRDTGALSQSVRVIDP
jgi:hypothetical protein